jgi:hypothetical protein
MKNPKLSVMTFDDIHGLEGVVNMTTVSPAPAARRPRKITVPLVPSVDLTC